jgi:hypothetical protein
MTESLMRTYRDLRRHFGKHSDRLLIFWASQLQTVKVKSYPRNRPWRPTGLWDVKAPTFF